MNTANKLFKALKNGEELTCKQIQKRYGVSNPRDPIFKLRRQGYPINLVREGKTRKYTLNSSRKSNSTYLIVG